MFGNSLLMTNLVVYATKNQDCCNLLVLVLGYFVVVVVIGGGGWAVETLD